MKTTCILFIVGTIAAIVGYFFAIQYFIPGLPGAAPFMLAILGGVSALLLFGAIGNLVQSISDNIVIGRAIKNASFRDGKRAAAIGGITSAGLASISAPLSGRECLAYEYEVYEMIPSPSKSGSATKKLHCTGFGMIPSTVRTSLGDIRILGFPIIDEWPKHFMQSEEDRARANTYISQTQFVNIKKNFGGIFSEFDDLFKDADGSVRKDLGDPVNIEEKHLLSEIIVPRGSRVCAIGVYSKKDNALFAKTAALPIRLIPGTAAEVERTLRKKSYGQIAFALAFFLIVNGILSLIFYSSKKERYNIPESEHFSMISRTAEARDFEELKRMFEHGINPNVTDSQSRTLLQTTQDDEVARLLLKSGANPNVEDPATLETPLFEAARTGKLTRMKVLIDGGANVNAVCAIPWQHTPIDEAIRAGQSEAIELLIQSGAIDPRVTAVNGQPLTAGGGEEIAICRKYLRAIHAKDTEILKEITTPRYDYFFDDIDFEVWKAAYPTLIDGFDGYSNDTAATILLRGTIADGSTSEWIYQLRKEQGAWKIHQTIPLSGGGAEITWR